MYTNDIYFRLTISQIIRMQNIEEQKQELLISIHIHKIYKITFRFMRKLVTAPSVSPAPLRWKHLTRKADFIGDQVSRGSRNRCQETRHGEYVSPLKLQRWTIVIIPGICGAKSSSQHSFFFSDLKRRARPRHDNNSCARSEYRFPLSKRDG